jgi:hypothetical protein
MVGLVTATMTVQLVYLDRFLVLVTVRDLLMSAMELRTPFSWVKFCRRVATTLVADGSIGIRCGLEPQPASTSTHAASVVWMITLATAMRSTTGKLLKDLSPITLVERTSCLVTELFSSSPKRSTTSLISKWDRKTTENQSLAIVAKFSMANQSPAGSAAGDFDLFLTK